jgi:hypothetical protein
MSPPLSTRRIIDIPKTVLSHTLFQNALAFGARFRIKRHSATCAHTPNIEIGALQESYISQKTDHHDLSMNGTCGIVVLLGISGANPTFPAFCANPIGGRNKHFPSLHNGTRVHSDFICINITRRSNCLHEPSKERMHDGYSNLGDFGGVEVIHLQLFITRSDVPWK